MNTAMNKMMENMMTRMMESEDMPQMISTMMDKMVPVFSAMTVEDRIQFVTPLMSKGLNMIFAELSPEEKEKLAREMINEMISIFKDQSGADTGRSHSNKPSSSRRTESGRPDRGEHRKSEPDEPHGK